VVHVGDDGDVAYRLHFRRHFQLPLRCLMAGSFQAVPRPPFAGGLIPQAPLAVDTGGPIMKKAASALLQPLARIRSIPEPPFYHLAATFALLHSKRVFPDIARR
jgi:hypothetical protein